jgi:hypothetical protein
VADTVTKAKDTDQNAVMYSSPPGSSELAPARTPAIVSNDNATHAMLEHTMLGQERGDANPISSDIAFKYDHIFFLGIGYYNNMDPYFGGGYGGMGGQGGMNPMMMMSSSGASSICFILLAGAAWLFLNNNKNEEKKNEPPPSTGDDEPPAPVGLQNGDYVITTGVQAMYVPNIGSDSQCGKANVLFQVEQGDRNMTWLVEQAMTLSDGTPVYTLENRYLKARGCRQSFLTAPKGCNSKPTIEEYKRTPLQHWLIIGDDSAGYKLRNVACKDGGWRYSYITQKDPSSGVTKQPPKFTDYSGTTFKFKKPIPG